jgi:Pyruvate/2-oxoacid:ferredoxin oxidoreductase delta subunit
VHGLHEEVAEAEELESRAGIGRLAGVVKKYAHSCSTGVHYCLALEIRSSSASLAELSTLLACKGCKGCKKLYPRQWQL